VLELRDEDSSIDGYRLLFDTYQPSAWYWELVVTARRLIMTGAIVALKRGSLVQFGVGILVSLTAALLQTTYSPYYDSR
jgi:hypothetical protein